MIHSRSFRGVGLLLAFLVGSQSAAAVTIQPGVQVGTLSDTNLNEVSGLAASHSLDGIFWVHNDSGDSPRFFAINTTGALQGTISLDSATAVDWEDIAIGPKPGGGNYLYLGDIGDNALGRTSGIQIYRLTEPLSSGNATIATANYTKVNLQYQGLTPKNAESLLVDPITGDLIIITKALTPQVYSAPTSIFDTPGSTATLTLLGNLNVTLPFPTAADISPDGMHILVRNLSTTAYLYERAPGQSVWDALQSTAIAVTLKTEIQGEAIGWAADGSGFYTTSELNGEPRPIWYYGFAVPEPATGPLLVVAFLTILGANLWISRRRFGRG